MIFFCGATRSVNNAADPVLSYRINVSVTIRFSYYFSPPASSPHSSHLHLFYTLLGHSILAKLLYKENMENKFQDNKSIRQMPSMEYPAMYRIRVRGQLDSSWSERLGGMTLTTTGGRDTDETTMLEGQLRDQAALTGILNTLYDMQLPLVSVECIDSLKKERRK
jgi:hypothetical protein